MRTDIPVMNAILCGISGLRPRVAELRLNHVPGELEGDLIGEFSGPVTPDEGSPCLPCKSFPEFLQTRRSVSHFRDEAVDARCVIHAVAQALEDDERLWGCSETAGLLEAFVFVLRDSVGGPGPGIYQVRRDSAVRMTTAAELGDPIRFGVQEEYFAGSGVVIFCANLDVEDGAGGANGYLVNTLRASMALYEVHVELGCMDVVGSVFGGFIPASLRSLLLADMVTRQQIISCSYGFPA